jgi:osmotically-inducible protein OsmY
MRKVFLRLAFISICLMLVCASGWAQSAPRLSSLTHQLQAALVDLPGYTIFDYITFRITEGRVVLLGHVLRPELRQKAEEAIRAVPGVTEIDNQIEVLPASADDNVIRQKAYAQLYSNPRFTWYAVQSVAPIHIVVKNGRVRLEGVVNSPSDRYIAESAISEVVASSALEDRLLASNTEFAELSDLRIRLQ